MNISKAAAVALASFQRKPFGMVAEKEAGELIAAGLATAASVQLSDEDEAANKGKVPLQCTLEGWNYTGAGEAPAATVIDTTTTAKA